MDFTALNGIIEAIEGEIRNPAPHHLNLAKLNIAALREIKNLLQPAKKEEIKPISSDVSEVEAEKPKKRSKKSK